VISFDGETAPWSIPPSRTQLVYLLIFGDRGRGRIRFVSTDPQSSQAVSERPTSPAIENELPTYRAISTQAVFSLLCGVLALFSFAHPLFYLFAVLAIVLGFNANRKIQRYPDMLTGRSLAQAGAAMGLIFGLGIFTISTVQGVIRNRKAVSFANHYADVMKTGGVADVLWLGLPPSQRKSVSPSEVMERMATTKKRESSVYEMKTATVRALKKRLDSSRDQDVHFVRFENEGTEGIVIVALALFEVHGPPTKEYPGDEYALAVIKGTSEGKGYEWWVEEMRYPYKPDTANLPEAPPVDDGHGHAH
jgi:hypothetical protein